MLLERLKLLDQTAQLWKSRELHLFFFSTRTGLLEEISSPSLRLLAKVANQLGIRTDTTVFRDTSELILLSFNTLQSEELPQDQQKLLALPLALLNAPPGVHELPDLALPPDEAAVLIEFFLHLHNNI